MKKAMLLLTLLLSMMLCIFTGCSKTDGGSGTVKMTLILEDKSEVEYDLNVEKETSLRQALYDNNLISEETYGAMFVEDIDGHVADVEEDGCTWLVQDADRKQIMGTFDDIMLTAGQTIYLEYYVVPDMD